MFNQVAKSEHSIDPQGKFLMLQHSRKLRLLDRNYTGSKNRTSTWGIYSVKVYIHKFKTRQRVTKRWVNEWKVTLTLTLTLSQLRAQCFVLKAGGRTLLSRMFWYSLQCPGFNSITSPPAFLVFLLTLCQSASSLPAANIMPIWTSASWNILSTKKRPNSQQEGMKVHSSCIQPSWTLHLNGYLSAQKF